jgi:hypothetical protein
MVLLGIVEANGPGGTLSGSPDPGDSEGNIDLSETPYFGIRIPDNTIIVSQLATSFILPQTKVDVGDTTVIGDATLNPDSGAEHLTDELTEIRQQIKNIKDTTNWNDAQVGAADQNKTALYRGALARLYTVDSDTTGQLATLYKRNVDCTDTDGVTQERYSQEQLYPLSRVDQSDTSTGGTNYTTSTTIIEDSENQQPFTPDSTKIGYENHHRVGIRIASVNSSGTYTSIVVTLHDSTSAGHQTVSSGSITRDQVIAAGDGAWIYVDMGGTLLLGAGTINNYVAPFHYHVTYVGGTGGGPYRSQSPLT